MTISYNVRAESTVPFDEAGAAQLLDDLADYHPAVSRGPFGHTEVIITLPAETLRQAILSGYTIVSAAFAPADVRLFEALPTDEFDRRLGLEPIADMVSVTQAAAELGVTRQAVLQRLEAGTLPGTKVGTTWVLPESSVRGAHVTHESDVVEAGRHMSDGPAYTRRRSPADLRTAPGIVAGQNRVVDDDPRRTAS